MRLGLITFISAAIVASGSAIAQPSPVVSPDPLPDVPLSSAPIDDDFSDYSWRSFIALNWPAQGGAAHRGLPDRDPKKSISDTNGPRVWMTWKSRYEIFQPGGRLPSPWASYDGQNPCGKDFQFADDLPTLGSFSAFGDFDQGNRYFGLTNPLVAQNRTYVRYDVRVNELEFDTIVGNKWYIHSNLPTPETAVPFNTGSTAVKAAWRILKKSEDGSRYYVTQAQVFDAATEKCVRQDVALVGFHIATRTTDRPQWLWSTFEQIDNVPFDQNDRPPQALPNGPFAFNDGKGRPMSQTRPAPISCDNPPQVDPRPTQVIRQQKIFASAVHANERYWKKKEIQESIWKYYMLVATQWPQPVASPHETPPGPTNDGSPFLRPGEALSNTTMETYFQYDGGSCMECHNTSNMSGRDFVMFVTIDAYRPRVPSPADVFRGKISDKCKAATALSRNPMLGRLIRFFEAAPAQRR